jgi:hypothetical protein
MTGPPRGAPNEQRSFHRPQPAAACAPSAGINVVPGDLILFTKNAGTDLRLDGEDYLILDPAGLLAVINTAAI